MDETTLGDIFKGTALADVAGERESLMRFCSNCPKALPVSHNDLLVRYVDCQSTGVMVTAQKCRGYGTAQVVYGYIVVRFCTFGKK